MKAAPRPLHLPALLLAAIFAAQPPALPAPGDAEPAFLGAGVFTRTTPTQPDGKIIVADSTTPVIYRIKGDGTHDPSFQLPSVSGFVWGARTAVVQGDGKIVIGLSISGGPPQQAVTRLMPDGTLDAAFQPGFVFTEAQSQISIRCMALQADGKILVGGFFSVVGGTTRDYLVRLNADGTLDTAFNPNPNNGVFTVAVQGDGKILVGGWFSIVGGVARSGIARLDTDGTLDTTFTTPSVYYAGCIVVQRDGKILAGSGSVVNRLRADGTVDYPAFQAPSVNGNVYSIALQADGKAIVGGEFTSVSSYTRNRLARLNTNGSVDTAFNPNAAGTFQDAPPWVASVTLQGDGKVLVAGNFQTVNGTPHPGLARLENNPATQSLLQTSANRIQWLRGGSSPEAQEVTFDISTDGDTTWTPLGGGTRIAGGWELTGASLPAAGHVRARARIPCGYRNGSSGLVETTMTLSPLLAQWKLANLGDAYAPDDGDPDGDGLPTLTEYALNFPPLAPNASPLVERALYPEGERLRMFFTRDPERNDVTIEVQAANSPAGPWSTVATSTLGGVTAGPGYVGGDSAGAGLKTVEVRDTVNLTDAPQRFLRVKVTH